MLPILASSMVVLCAMAQGGIDPPGIDQVTYGVNMLTGLPVSQQRRAYIGKKLFHLTRLADSGSSTVLHNGYNGFKEISDFSNAETCSYSEQQTQYYWSMSSSSLSSQSSASSKGFDKTTDLGVTVPVGGTASVSASTSIRNAMVFGNSDSSNTMKAESANENTRSYSAKGEGKLYTAVVDYENVDQWDDNFKTALEGLSSSTTPAEFFNFFKEFGTHGLERVSLGQVCTTTLFMKEGSEMSVYSDTVEEVTNNDIGFMWFHHTSSESSSQTNSGGEVSGTQYTISNKRCEGSLSRSSACMAGSEKDVPVILNWSLMPIWKMPMDTNYFSNEARTAMEEAFTSLMQSAVDCAELNCSSNGGCAPNLKEWMSVGDVRQDYLFSYDACFCAEGWEGSHCETQSGQMDPVTPPANTEFTFKTNQVIGLYSLELLNKDKGNCWLRAKGLQEVRNQRHTDFSTLPNDKKWRIQVVDKSDTDHQYIMLESLSNANYHLHSHYSHTPCILEYHEQGDFVDQCTFKVHWVDKAKHLFKLEGLYHNKNQKWVDSHGGEGDQVRLTNDGDKEGAQWYYYLVSDPEWT